MSTSFHFVAPVAITKHNRPKRYVAGFDDEDKMCVYDCYEHVFVYRSSIKNKEKVRLDVENRFKKSETCFTVNVLKGIEDHYRSNPEIEKFQKKTREQVREKTKCKKHVLMKKVVNLLDKYRIGAGRNMIIEFETLKEKNILRAHLINEESPKGVQFLDLDLDKPEYKYVTEGVVRKSKTHLEDLFKNESNN